MRGLSALAKQRSDTASSKKSAVAPHRPRTTSTGIRSMPRSLCVARHRVCVAGDSGSALCWSQKVGLVGFDHARQIRRLDRLRQSQKAVAPTKRRAAGHHQHHSRVVHAQALREHRLLVQLLTVRSQSGQRRGTERVERATTGAAPRTTNHWRHMPCAVLWRHCPPTSSRRVSIAATRKNSAGKSSSPSKPPARSPCRRTHSPARTGNAL
jgi:hypothetical protein